MNKHKKSEKRGNEWLWKRDKMKEKIKYKVHVNTKSTLFMFNHFLMLANHFLIASKVIAALDYACLVLRTLL